MLTATGPRRWATLDGAELRCRRGASSICARMAFEALLGHHPPHADQRVGTRPEHQLLQVADLVDVPIRTPRSAVSSSASRPWANT
jgi:hypothetical protein